MDDNDGLLVVHGTGCGKTLSAVTATQCYLDKYPNRGVVFVGPASLISNFKKELQAYGVELSNKYEFYSFDKFMLEDKAGRAISLKNKFLVVDEAHNLRNAKSLKSKAVLKAAMKADKRLLLSATPFVNSLTDFIPLINMIHGKIKVGSQKQYNENEVDEYLGKKITDHNLTTFRYLLEDKVDMVDCKDPNDFPEKIEHYIDVPMKEEYYSRYEKLIRGESLFSILFKNPEKFLNGYRRAVNKAGDQYYSDKIAKAIPHLKKGNALIYTNWIEFGIRPISQVLKSNNITFKIFSGEIPKEDRQQIINDFNDKKFDVLIITKAGGEGIDLKGVRSVTVLDPTWNSAGLDQIIGRAIRYKSHAHLPESQRNVNVYLMALIPPESVKDPIPSGDKLLYQIIDQKNEISTAILGLLKELSI
jgi:superfamily II DNA or RNA helicase